MNQKLLKIGDIAKMFNINIQTLRYYDRENLFVPNVKDPYTGWRYYEFGQIYQLATIRYLRSMDCSMDYIRDFLNNGEPQESIQKLHRQSEQLKEKYRELMRLDTILQGKVNFLEKELLKMKNCSEANGGYHLEECPVRRYMDMGNEMNLYHHAQFLYYPTLAFYKNTDISFGALLFDTETWNGMGLPDESPDCKEIPAGQYLTTYYEGPYQTIWPSLDRLCEKAQVDRGTDIVCTNIIDLFVESDTKRFVTKLQIRIPE